MVLFAHDLADLLQRNIGQMPAEIHGDLAGTDDLGITFVSFNIIGGNAKMLGYRVNDQGRRYFLLFIGGNNVLEFLLAISMVIAFFSKRLQAMSLFRAPSSSRILDLIFVAMYLITSSSME